MPMKRLMTAATTSLLVAAVMVGAATLGACRGGVDGFGDGGPDSDTIGSLGESAEVDDCARLRAGDAGDASTCPPS